MKGDNFWVMEFEAVAKDGLWIHLQLTHSFHCNSDSPGGGEICLPSPLNLGGLFFFFFSWKDFLAVSTGEHSRSEDFQS